LRRERRKQLDGASHLRRCCMDDEGGPLAAALQGEAANHRKVRRSRAVRAERCGKGELSARQVRTRKASESDPLMTCRKSLRRDQNRGRSWPSGRAWRVPVYRPGGLRHTGGASLAQAFMRNSGTCRSETATARAWDAWSREGDPQAAETARGRVPVAGHRGGPARSSDEGPVMGLERRGWVTRASPAVNRVSGRNCRSSSESDGQPCSGKVHPDSSRPVAVGTGWVARAG
jgi:hypothetical protein